MQKPTLNGQPGAPGDQLFRLTEAQNFLRLGRSSFFDLLKTGAIPYSRIGQGDSFGGQTSPHS